MIIYSFPYIKAFPGIVKFLLKNDKFFDAAISSRLTFYLYSREINCHHW
jgi:hypothetical protein